MSEREQKEEKCFVVIRWSLGTIGVYDWLLFEGQVLTAEYRLKF